MFIINVARFLYHAEDPAALGVARFFYGLIMLIDIFEERGLHSLEQRYGDPDLCIFPLFNNMPVFPLEYLYAMFLVMILCSIGIMLGFMFKLSCLGFTVIYWYFFFLNKTTWNNHSYLYGLLSILWLFSNANFYWSIDSLIWPSIYNKLVPRFNYIIIKFQLFILYFYAGIKKLDADWTSGYSMAGLGKSWVFDPFHFFFSDETVDYLFVHIGGLVFDLSVGFLFLNDKTRPLGYLLAYFFHGMNAIIFNIGMFSYMCMAMIPIFSAPNWPKKIIEKTPWFIRMLLPTCSSAQENVECTKTTHHTETLKNIKNEKDCDWSFTMNKAFKCIFFTFYVAMQLFLPFSHSITKGYNSWTDGLYGYSWDMMVHSWNTQHVVVKVIDDVTGEKQYLRPGAFTSSKSRIFSHPDMIKQYATCLSKRLTEVPDLNITHPKIYFDVWTSLNKRYQQRRLDPRVDLVKAPWSPTKDTPWLMPLLVELSPWRARLEELKKVSSEKNYSDVVFVADFPGLSLENFIAEDIEANITVLSGLVVIEANGKNVTLAANETLALPENDTHIVYTISKTPSCYMYISHNKTWVNMTDDDIINNDEELKKSKLAKEEWNSKTIFQKLLWFLSKKYRLYKQDVNQIYFALKIILNMGATVDNKVLKNDEL
ncbi:vitamin K-dependent gamma-carboxylase isoform X2 [Hydra vulgaris]|uniref:Vitamin K-dependent gamma-carboxylase n=1 Tax=Hydra vulgaris TaxID=6087 RepID=A0ABM4C0W6_HYDVU